MRKLAFTGLAIAVLASLWPFVSPTTVVGQGSVLIRPSSSTTAGPNSLNNPERAYDINGPTTAAWSNDLIYCNTICITPRTRQTEFWGFASPASGYRPVTLTVTWQVGMGFNQVYAPDTAIATTTIEYSKDSGASWTEMARHTGPPNAAGEYYVTPVALPPTQDLSQLKVRATSEVRMTYCSSCGRISGASVSLWVNDITVSVERPQLMLFLDIDGNFDPSAPTSDLPVYVPGTDPATGLSKAVPPPGESLIETVKVIAAYTVSNGKIAPPPDGVSSAFITLSDTSSFYGVAMNYGPSGGADFQMPTSVWPFSESDYTARADLEVHDYGGLTTVNATAGPVPDVATMRIPYDQNANWVPDAGWKATANGVVIGTVPDAGQAASADSDAAPTGNGTAGDGLVFYEEYRGFVVRGEHRRTDPAIKDLLIYSELLQGIADAENLTLTKHRIRLAEMDGAYNIINANYTNGNTTQGNVPGHYSQEALKVLDGGYGDGQYYGRTSVVGPPSAQVGPILVFVLKIWEDSPTRNDLENEDPYDDEATRYVIGHEIGHGISIIHNPSFSSIMVTQYLGKTTDISDPHWMAIPHAYDSTDQSQICLK